MSAYTFFFVKAILFDAFIMYQSYKMLKSGEIDFICSPSVKKVLI